MAGDRTEDENVYSEDLRLPKTGGRLVLSSHLFLPQMGPTIFKIWWVVAMLVHARQWNTRKAAIGGPINTQFCLLPGKKQRKVGEQSENG